MSVDWRKPFAMKAGDGEIIPARLSGLNLGGKGVYLYTKRYMSALNLSQFGPDDIGIDQEYFDPASGQSVKGLGVIVNVPAELLDDTIFDPATGKEYRVPEREVRRRIQQAVAAAQGGVAPASKQRITLVVETGFAKVVSVENMP